MKKLILALILIITMITPVSASSEDWRSKFIGDYSSEFYSSFGSSCVLTKPDDMPDYIYAVYTDSSLSASVVAIVGGDADAIAAYDGLRKAMDAFSSLYYSMVQLYNTNGHFSMCLLNPLDTEKILYISTDGKASYDAFAETTAPAPAPTATPVPATPATTTEPTTESYDLDLTAGHYIGGLGIPTGRYTLTWVANSGNVHSPMSVNEIFREDKTTVYNNFDFNTGTELEVSGGLVLHIHTDNARFEGIRQREIEKEVETILAPGNYIAGTDFPGSDHFVEVSKYQQISTNISK